MYLPAPDLDDRKFQDLVNDAKRLIPTFCPTWTDHNVSDPGVTLIELFAWMTEQLLYRLNQVPDKNYVAFLDLLGVRLRPPTAARGAVTFTLTAPVAEGNRVLIPRWTEVATERTEAEEAIIFTTDHDAEVRPAGLTFILTYPDKDRDEGEQNESEARRERHVFTVWPDVSPANALYLGFTEDLSSHTLVLTVACVSKAGRGPNTAMPAPWQWEILRDTERTGAVAAGGDASEGAWEPLEVARDETQGLNEDGRIVFYLPDNCVKKAIGTSTAKTWLRCSPVRPDRNTGQTPYTQSPQVMQLTATTLGITVPVTHAHPVQNEDLGVSNGQPGQRFRLRFQNILDPQLSETPRPDGGDESQAVVLEVEDEQGEFKPWQRVKDFAQSRPGYTVAVNGRRDESAMVDVTDEDKHYVLDPRSGVVEFGPAIRQPNGSEPKFGAVPPQGRRIRMKLYYTGGGIQGNVAEHKVEIIKTTVPYVQGVTNRAKITGGLDAQTLDDAKFSAPALLRTRDRAVTAEDYEYLAMQVQGVGRARCLQPTANSQDPKAPKPGQVRLLIIPEFQPLTPQVLAEHIALRDAIRTTPDERRFEPVEKIQQELYLSPDTIQRVKDALNPRRLLTTRMEVDAPAYYWVHAEVEVHPQPRADRKRVETRVREALYRYLHPVYGGPDGQGWPFGQGLTVDRVYVLLRNVEGVDYVQKVELFTVNMLNTRNLKLERPRDEKGAIDPHIRVSPNGVVVSYYHDVILV